MLWNHCVGADCCRGDHRYHRAHRSGQRHHRAGVGRCDRRQISSLQQALVVWGECDTGSWTVTGTGDWLRVLWNNRRSGSIPGTRIWLVSWGLPRIFGEKVQSWKRYQQAGYPDVRRSVYNRRIRWRFALSGGWWIMQTAGLCGGWHLVCEGRQWRLQME